MKEKENTVKFVLKSEAKNWNSKNFFSTSKKGDLKILF